MDIYLGVDVGSVTTKLVALDEAREVLGAVYLRTEGNPLAKVQEGLLGIEKALPSEAHAHFAALSASDRQAVRVLAASCGWPTGWTARTPTPCEPSGVRSPPGAW